MIEINNKLKEIYDAFADDVLAYLYFLNFKNANHDFKLSDNQIELLESRSKTPIEQFIPSEILMTNLKNKYSV
jgi:hypothetical protein